MQTAEPCSAGAGKQLNLDNRGQDELQKWGAGPHSWEAVRTIKALSFGGSDLSCILALLPRNQGPHGCTE